MRWLEASRSRKHLDLVDCAGAVKLQPEMSRQLQALGKQVYAAEEGAVEAEDAAVAQGELRRQVAGRAGSRQRVTHFIG